MSVRAMLGWGVAAGLLAGVVPAPGAAQPAPLEGPRARLAGAGGVATSSVSPMDVIHPDDLLAQGYTTLPQILASLVPSFVYPEPALAEFTDHARPAALRGLAPDQMVVLLNGERRQPAAWLHRDDTFGRGSVGVDLSVIPLSAVQRIEILRDGASARYGSGAMAGVINVVLKDATDGGSLVATFGQYRTHLAGVPDIGQVIVRSPREFFLLESGEINTDDGEGDTLTLAAHGGFSLFDDGYLDITAEFRDQDPTNRAGFDYRRLYPRLANGDLDPRETLVDRRTFSYGNPQQEDVKLLTNFGMPLGERTEFYGHIGYTARNAESAGAFVIPRSDANVPAVYPDGYLPLLSSDDESRYYSFGFRGRRRGWDWDLSYVQDEHEMDMEVRNSLNPALGVISPTSFPVGNYEGRHASIGLDVARDVDVGLHQPLAVTWGLEYRNAEYENEFGERASYVALGSRTADGVLRPPGSRGFVGVRPVDDFDDARLNLGGYLQLDAAMTPRVNALLALRYDDEEGSNAISVKLGAGWQVNDRLWLRGSLSRDFRHPSPAQTYFFASELVAEEAGYGERGTYPADHPVAAALGAQELDTETAVNVSGGFEWDFAAAASLSLNLYRVEIDDRIVLSDYLSGPAVDDVLAGEGITGVTAARYFFNGVDLRVQGLDLAANYRWQSPGGPVQLGAGYNLNDMDVTGSADDPPALAGRRFGERDQAQLERWTPDSKLHLSARWQGRWLGVDARLSRYGEVTDVGEVPAQDLDLGAAWLLDLHLRYRLTERGYAGFGVYNMLDEYVDVRPREDADPAINRLLPYSNYAPFGFNGRYVYLRVGMDLSAGGQGGSAAGR